MESYKSSARRATITHKSSVSQSQKSLLKFTKPVNVTKSFASPQSEHKASLNPKQPIKHTLNPDEPDNPSKDLKSKSSAELAIEVKRCIEELKEEASLCVNSSLRSYKNSLIASKRNTETCENPDTFETEVKGSFIIKNGSSKESNIKLTPTLGKNDVSDLKDTIEILMARMKQSEIEAKAHETENLKLKEAILSLEDKLESIKIFHDPVGVSCNSKCGIF